MVGIPPIKMVMTGGWFIFAVPTGSDGDCLTVIIESHMIITCLSFSPTSMITYCEDKIGFSWFLNSIMSIYVFKGISTVEHQPPSNLSLVSWQKVHEEFLPMATRYAAAPMEALRGLNSSMMYSGCSCESCEGAGSMFGGISHFANGLYLDDQL